MTEKENKEDSTLLNEQITRRKALSRTAKIAIGAGAVVVVGGGLGYWVLTQPGTTTSTSTSTTSSTTTSTTTSTGVTTITPTFTGGITASTNPNGIHLDLTAWDYDVSKVQDNINKCMAKYPNMDIKMYNFSWPDYPSAMIQRFVAKTPTDIYYNGEDWLAQHAAATWVIPLEDIWDQYQTNHKFKFYKDDMVPYAIDSMTYNGKIYGLPYYSDTVNFIYNSALTEQAGLTEVPKDWDEVRQNCLTLKEKGIGGKYPFVATMQATNPHDIDNIFSAAKGRGGTAADMFDKDLNPIFNKSDHPFYQQVQWLVDGVNKDKFVNPEYATTHETDAEKLMQAGNGVYAVLNKYTCAAMNQPGASQYAGKFRIGLMPGKEHGSYGFAKFYCITKMAQDRGKDVLQQAINWVEYFGASDGPVLKRWMVENALGFGFLSPYDDPDIAKAFEDSYGPGQTAIIKQQCKLATCLPHPVWYGQWLDYSMKECILQAFNNAITVPEALNRMDSQWKTLKG